MLPKVKLFDVKPPPSGSGQRFTFLVQQQLLTKESEMEIFGNIAKYHDELFGDYTKKLAVIDQENVDLYNNKIERLYHRDPHLISSHQIVAGIVEVNRASYNVKLKNVKQEEIVLFEELI